MPHISSVSQTIKKL